MKLNKMVFTKVISNELKQKLCDLVSESVRASFEVQTDEWEPTSREKARLFLKEFIENVVEEKMHQVLIE